MAESLSTYKRVVSRELTLRQAASMRSKHVTIGSYYRTVKQAKAIIKRSIMTSLIATWLGLVKLEDLRKLLELGGRDLNSLQEDEKARLTAVLDSLLDQMVT